MASLHRSILTVIQILIVSSVPIHSNGREKESVLNPFKISTGELESESESESDNVNYTKRIVIIAFAY